MILKCKDESGVIIPWTDAQGITFQSWRQTNYTDHDRGSPLARIAELFNVNHFIVSQARPYIAPFLKNELDHPKPHLSGASGIATPIIRLVTLEIHHRLSQAPTSR